VKRTGK